MLIVYHNEKKLLPYKEKLQQVFDDALDYLGLDNTIVEVDLSLVSPREIKRLNAEYRGLNKTTDILSFPTLLAPNVEGVQLVQSITKEEYPHDINFETGNIMLGSMYLNFKQAVKQSKMYGTTLEREVVYLCLHSLLHLLGYDHMIESDKVIMRKVEEDVLSRNFVVR